MPPSSQIQALQIDLLQGGLQRGMLAKPFLLQHLPSHLDEHEGLHQACGDALAARLGHPMHDVLYELLNGPRPWHIVGAVQPGSHMPPGLDVLPQSPLSDPVPGLPSGSAFHPAEAGSSDSTMILLSITVHLVLSDLSAHVVPSSSHQPAKPAGPACQGRFALPARKRLEIHNLRHHFLPESPGPFEASCHPVQAARPAFHPPLDPALLPHSLTFSWNSSSSSTVASRAPPGPPEGPSSAGRPACRAWPWSSRTPPIWTTAQATPSPRVCPLKTPFT